MIKLYYAPGMCSQAPHILLREAGTSFELHRVDLQSHRTEQGENYLAINPNGYVPALEMPDGTVLTEVAAIAQYVADLAPQSGLAPAFGTVDRYRLQSWLNFIATEIHKGFSPLFKPTTPPEYKAHAKEILGRRLDVVEQRLAESTFLMGEHFGASDAYLFVVTGWAGFVDLSLQPFARLRAFRDRVSSRPAVREALRAEGLLRR